MTMTKKSKGRKPNWRKEKIDYLTPDQIRQSLWDHGWRNDTQSPITTQPYWDNTAKIIPSDAEPISGFFATSYAGSAVYRVYTFICTTKYVYCIVQVAGLVTYKILKYEDFVEISLYQDEYLASQIYIDIYLTKFRFYKLEASDPTSVLDFKKTIIKQQIALGDKQTLRSLKNYSFAKRNTISFWRFIWRKFRFLFNAKTDIKLKHEIKKQRRMRKLEEREAAEKKAELEKLTHHEPTKAEDKL